MRVSVSTFCLLLWSLVEVHSQTFPYVSFGSMGQALADHSYVNISTVGSDGDNLDGVVCHTDLATCCSGGQGPHRGDWSFPNGTVLPSIGPDVPIALGRTDKIAVIRRTGGATGPTGPTGIYRCDIPTIAVHGDTDIFVGETVYVGLYPADGGDVTISGDEVTFDSDQMALTCISTGGPATTVTWTRDSINTEGNETVLDDPETAQYTHTLNVTTGGEYTCTVSNNKPSSDSATITLGSASPPSGVTAVQAGPTSIRVSWTPPSSLGDTTGYRIYYTRAGGSSDSENIDGGNTISRTLMNLTNGETYTISVVGTSTSPTVLPSLPVPAGDVALVPSAAVLDDPTTVTATTIRITGSVPGSVVTGFVVEWQRDTSVGCSDVNERTISEDVAFTSYTITGLEPGNRYTITVTVSNSAGTSPVSNTVTAMTPETAPTDSPMPREGTVTARSITIAWDELACLDRNGVITSYIVEARAGGEADRTVNVNDGSAREATFSGLTPSTNYTVSLQAVNSADSGPIRSIAIETPDGLSVQSVISSTNKSLTISWALEEGVTATSYSISYSATDTSCFTGSNTIPDIAGSETMYRLPGLEEGTEYSITVTATITGGGSQQDVAVGTTMVAAPSAPPSSVRVSVESSTAISVQWGPVEPCTGQNGPITGYSVRYGEMGSESTQTKTVSGEDSRMTTISELTKETVYTVEVAAETRAGTGVYSLPLTIQTPDNVYLSLDGTVILNHGYVEIGDIGSNDDSALLCYTNNPPPPGSTTSGGNWHAPTGTRVFDTDVTGVTLSRAAMVVRLKRRTSGTPPEGIYRCTIEDATLTPQMVYVGLYTTGKGRIMVSTLPPYSDLNGDSPQFTLTCISTGGPATTVTWIRGTVNITEGNETVLNDRETAQYTHTLNVTAAGDYRCTVSNTAFSNSTDITLEGTSPPSDVTAVQEGPTSIRVSWTLVSGATGYRVEYSVGEATGEESAGGSSTTLIITGLQNGLTYTISLVAISPDLPTSAPITKQVTLVPPPEEPVIADEVVMITSDSISFSWVLPADSTGSEVSWRLSGQRRRRAVRNAEEGSSDRLSGNSYTIEGLRSGTSYEITLTTFNPAGSSSTTFTRSTAPGKSTSGSSGNGAAVGGAIAAIIIVLIIVVIVIVVILILRRRGSTVSKYIPAEKDTVRYSSKDGKVTSGEAPVIQQFPEDTRVQEGEGVVFQVEVTGSPQPKLTWYHDGVEVKGDYSKELAEDGSLTMPSAETKHSGVYQLVAANKAGSVEREVKLEVGKEGAGPADEEPSYESVPLTGPIPVAIFGDHVSHRHSKNNKPFKDEYEGLPTHGDKSIAIATSSDNRLKNRFANICVYDDNRVELKPMGQHPSDYVNASYIDGYSTRSKFIATQGPLPKTVVDFWRLVWQERTPTVVMITKLVEGTKIKCQQYWPDTGAQTYGPFQVSITDQQILADYTIRSLLLQLKGGSERPLKVTQFHFTAWPDHGVPDYATPILAFHRRVLREHKSGPIVVHCSAGVGRSGTFITVDQCLEQVGKENKVDIPGIISRLREQRTKMVQTTDQYIFIHDAILEAVTCGDTQVVSGDLRSTITKMQRKDHSGSTAMELQFAVLEQVSPNPKDAKVGIALKHPKKNRSRDFLPLDKWRVIIKGESPDYVNASVAHGYKQQRAFIIAQSPMQSTARDFWKIVYDRKCGVIVTLCDLTEGGKEVCYPYWPRTGAQTFGEFTVELLDEEMLSGFAVRNFGVYNSKTDKAHQVSHFQITNWAPDGSCPNIKTVTDVIEEVGKVQRRTGNHPILVHCSDTVSRSGMFCAIATTIERCKTEGVVDVFQVVKALRVQKPGAVRTVLQYRIMFEAVLEYLDSFALYSNF